MKESAISYLNECFKEAEKETEELKHDAQAKGELEKRIREIKHNSKRYIQKLEEGQRQTHNLWRDKAYRR